MRRIKDLRMIPMPLLLLLAAVTLTAAVSGMARADRGVTLRTRSASFAIDGTGAVKSIVCSGSHKPGVNFIAPGQPSPLLSLRINGKIVAPDSANWEPGTSRLTLKYAAIDGEVVLHTAAKASHVVFTILQAKAAAPIELALWGPYPTTIGETIGDTIGVVRNADVAVGIQSLNPKTLGGYPTHENDIEEESSGDDHGIYPDIPAELLKGQGYRGDTAKPTSFGSTLQAYCRNRDQQRIIANWGHPKYLVLPFADGGIIGSSIALFACSEPKALETIGKIEIAEHLPHPMLDGVWGKVSSTATSSYLIVDFSEDNVDQAIAMARRAGLKDLYHSSPFETWGHFKLKSDLFPHGEEGLRACIEKGRLAGIRIGFHTLSNFITPNDSYVTPVPDKRLARVGSSLLAADISAIQTEIPVVSPDYFQDKSALNTVVIGNELVRFGSISTAAPWRLLECQRGAWGTGASSHAAAASVERLLDHPYNTFHTDADLSLEVARNIAAVCNRTGAQQLSFDGLEGNWSTGYGQYGRTLFTNAWYDALSPELKGHVINDASNPGHFNWHIYTRMNWGEPWYAGFRESQTLYRFKNQVYFERNLMPRMLGWFALRPDTSIEDAEWLLARAAGYDAGFALATSLASTAQLTADPSSADTARVYGATPAILEAIHLWEAARKARLFPPAVRAELRDNSREFHLQPVLTGHETEGNRSGKQWDLFEIHATHFAYSLPDGMATEYRFDNRDAGQPLQWIVRAVGDAAIASLTLELDGKALLHMNGHSIPAGGSIKYSGGQVAVICDANWKEVDRVPVDGGSATVTSGSHTLRVSTEQSHDSRLKIELRTYSAPQRLPAR